MITFQEYALPKVDCLTLGTSAKLVLHNAIKERMSNGEFSEEYYPDPERLNPEVEDALDSLLVEYHLLFQRTLLRRKRKAATKEAADIAVLLYENTAESIRECDLRGVDVAAATRAAAIIYAAMIAKGEE